GGAVSPTALVYSGPITLTQSVRVQARVLSASVWSALSDATLYLIQNFTGLMITEMMYHPPSTTNYDGSAFEFIELKNVASTNLELSGVRFTNGIRYTFPVGTFVAPGQFIVLTSDPAAFTNKYPGIRVDGVYTNNLSNSGETVALLHATGTPIFSATYESPKQWPTAADGTGFSLVPVNP